jgi:hypothetical protein
LFTWCRDARVPSFKDRRLRRTSLAAVLLVSFASVSYAQITGEHLDGPVFRSQGWGYIVADFTIRVASYMELRRKLEKGLPSLVVTANPAEITRAQRALARRIRSARHGAKQGDIFTAGITAEFRNVLLPEMSDDVQEAIMDDNPGEFSLQINGTYPRGRTFSTMPANILAVLPALPDDIQYRFVGHHLVLLDIRANVILDRIDCAVQCRK